MKKSDEKKQSSHKQYLHPPIIDAIIELKFATEITEAEKLKISKRFASNYEIVEDVVAQKISVAVNSKSVSTTSLVVERIIKRSSIDEPHFVQIGDRILNVACGAPYEGWEALFERFCSCWAIAKKGMKFRPIERIGVRYINRLDLKPNRKGQVQYENYLRLRINLPKDFQLIFDYNLMFQTSLEDIQCGVTVRSGPAPPAVPGRSSFLLDVDVWRDVDVPQRENEVYELLGQMRQGKNSLFETFITDKARALFDAV